MKRYDYDMIVIGAGAGGLSLSAGAGQLGLKTLLVEKEEKLGGDCLHYGCVPSKTLIKSARAYYGIKRAAEFGLPKVDLPSVDFKAITARIRSVIDTIQKHDTPEEMRRYNVDTLFGSPRFIDSHTIALRGRKITSRYFTVATGSSAFIPPIPGLNDVPFITSKDIFSLNSLPASLLVLGGGPIAVEMAQAFSRLGSSVTVAELMPHILPREDEDVALYITDILEKEGIKIYTGAKAVKVDREGKYPRVSVDIKGIKKILKTEMLLVATGRRPNVQGLDLEKAGVEYSPKGIPVDKRLRTNIKHIFGCGDVIDGYQFTHVANYEAGIILSNAGLHLPFKADYSCVPWCTFLDPEIASVGLNESEARKQGIAFTAHKADFSSNDRALAEGSAEGFIKLLVNKKGAVIGAQIVGAHAGELIHEWIVVLNGKLSLSKIARSIHIYPTLSEINKKISGDYLAPALFNKNVRRLLKLLFKFHG